MGKEISRRPISYAYRPVAFWVYYLLFYGSVFAEIILIRTKILGVLNRPWYVALSVIILASSVPLTILYRLWFFVRPRIFSTYEICEDRILIHFRKLTKEVAFDQIRIIKISHFSPRFLGGFSIWINSGQRFIFLSVLKGNHKILEQIANKRPDLIDSRTLGAYLALSELVEISWQRMAAKCKNWPRILVKYAAWGLIFGFLSLQMVEAPPKESALNYFMTQAAIWTFINYVIAGLLNHFEERITIKHILNSEGQARDIAFEKRIGLVSEISFYLITLTLFFTVK